MSRYDPEASNVVISYGPRDQSTPTIRCSAGWHRRKCNMVMTPANLFAIGFESYQGIVFACFNHHQRWLSWRALARRSGVLAAALESAHRLGGADALYELLGKIRYAPLGQTAAAAGAGSFTIVAGSTTVASSGSTFSIKRR